MTLPNMTGNALVVTGGARGIGAEIARRAAAAGTPVAVLHRLGGRPATDVVEAITTAGGRAVGIGVDLGDEESVRKAFAEVDRRLGAIGGLVNNAVDAGGPTPLAELRMADAVRLLRVNVAGALACVREAAGRMAAGGIVSLSSARAVHTGGSGGWLAFAAAKAGLEAVSRGLAVDLAPTIRVNVVRVGVADTETRRSQGAEYVERLVAAVPQRRAATVGEIAAAVLWLLSDEAAYVTGAVLDVTGGL